MASDSAQTDYFDLENGRNSGDQQVQIQEGNTPTEGTTTALVEPTPTSTSAPTDPLQIKTNRLLTMKKVYQRTPPFPCNWPSLLCMFVEINSLEKELAREREQQQQTTTENGENAAANMRRSGIANTHRIQRSPAVSNLNADSLHIPQATPDLDTDEQLSARERIVKTEKAILIEEIEFEDKQKKLKKLTSRLAALRHRNSNEHHQKYVTLLEDIIVDKSFEPCAICLENPETPSMTPCGHIFCATCISGAIKYQYIESSIDKNWCPVCRDKLEIRDLVEIPTNLKLTKNKPFPWPWNWGKPPQLEAV